MRKKQQKKYQAELKKILETVIEKYKPEKVVLFGSTAKGNMEEGSDIDLLAIKKTRKRRVDRILEVSRYLEDTFLPVDILVYTPEEFLQAQADNLMFIEEVVNHGKVIYEKS